MHRCRSKESKVRFRLVYPSVLPRQFFRRKRPLREKPIGLGGATVLGTVSSSQSARSHCCDGYIDNVATLRRHSTKPERFGWHMRCVRAVHHLKRESGA